MSEPSSLYRSETRRPFLLLAFVILAAMLFFHSRPAKSAEPPLAPTPPMGWNSWDSFGARIRESEVKSNADYMAAHMAKFGWKYIVVDVEWYALTPRTPGSNEAGELVMDNFGRFIPAADKFPSSAGGKGLKPLADYIHQKGLKFGIHIMRGVPRKAADRNLPIEGSRHRAGEIADRKNLCKWNADMYGIDMTRPGAQDYYDSIARLYAGWGVDYVKADDMSSPYQAAEIEGLSAALRKCGRPIVLSLSPGNVTPIAHAEHLAKYAHLWRISQDFWDDWKLLKAQFSLTERWAPYVRPNAWPDADMLPFGRISIYRQEGEPERRSRFTKDEQMTVMTLWSIFRSPLMMGGDLTANDEFTLSILTNAEVLRVDQHSTNNRPVEVTPQRAFWVAETEPKGGYYIAAFNLADTAQTLAKSWQELGLSAGSYKLRDLWAHRDLGAASSLKAVAPPHGAVLYRALR